MTDVDGGPATRIVFSGDLGRTDTPILRDPTIVTDADYVLVESTYGGREHEPEEEAIRILAETVRLVAESDGVLLVPSFAIGRTQEVVWELDRLLEQGKIPPLPLYLDSPMASKASDIYRRHPDYYDEETRTLLEHEASPLDYPAPGDRQRLPGVAGDRPGAAAVHDRRLERDAHRRPGRRPPAQPHRRPDGRSCCSSATRASGTLGAHLQAGAKTVKLDGQPHQVRCQIRSISGFSAHADESELLDWLGHFGSGKRSGDAGFPRRVFLVHGDPDAQAALEPKVQALGFDTVIPHWHQVVELD